MIWLPELLPGAFFTMKVLPRSYSDMSVTTKMLLRGWACVPEMVFWTKGERYVRKDDSSNQPASDKRK